MENITDRGCEQKCSTFDRFAHTEHFSYTFLSQFSVDLPFYLFFWEPNSPKLFCPEPYLGISLFLSSFSMYRVYQYYITFSHQYITLHIHDQTNKCWIEWSHYTGHSHIHRLQVMLLGFFYANIFLAFNNLFTAKIADLLSTQLTWKANPWRKTYSLLVLLSRFSVWKCGSKKTLSEFRSGLRSLNSRCCSFSEPVFTTVCMLDKKSTMKLYHNLASALGPLKLSW